MAILISIWPQRAGGAVLLAVNNSVSAMYVEPKRRKGLWQELKLGTVLTKGPPSKHLYVGTHTVG